MALQSGIKLFLGISLLINVSTVNMVFTGLKFELKSLNVSPCESQNLQSENLSLLMCALQCSQNINCLGFVTDPQYCLTVTGNLGCNSENSKYFEIECSEFCSRSERNMDAGNSIDIKGNGTSPYHSECQCAVVEDSTDSLTEANTDCLTEASTDSLTEASTDSLTEVSTDSLTEVSTDSLTEVSTDSQLLTTAVAASGGVDNASYQAGVAKLFISSDSQITNSMNVGNECNNRANRGTTVMVKDQAKQDIVSRFIRENGIPGAKFWIGVSKSDAQTMIHVDNTPLGSFQPWAVSPTPECLRAYILFETTTKWACETDQNAQYRYICDKGT